ncbi:hypothetical protein F5Y14DRAFT_428022 [Nemania sp. NC0429]|nr:hypothetical protein F5Y14DRAFT_428022 [Nemania sp. NC0429]
MYSSICSFCVCACACVRARVCAALCHRDRAMGARLWYHVLSMQGVASCSQVDMCICARQAGGVGENLYTENRWEIKYISYLPDSEVVGH